MTKQLSDLPAEVFDQLSVGQRVQEVAKVKKGLLDKIEVGFSHIKQLERTVKLIDEDDRYVDG